MCQCRGSRCRRLGLCNKDCWYSRDSPTGSNRPVLEVFVNIYPMIVTSIRGTNSHMAASLNYLHTNSRGLSHESTRERASSTGPDLVLVPLYKMGSGPFIGPSITTSGLRSSIDPLEKATGKIRKREATVKRFMIDISLASSMMRRKVGRSAGRRQHYRVT